MSTNAHCPTGYTWGTHDQGGCRCAPAGRSGGTVEPDSPSRPAGLSGDAGPTPEPGSFTDEQIRHEIAQSVAVSRAAMAAHALGDHLHGWDESSSDLRGKYLAAARLAVLPPYRAAVERVGQLEALVRDLWRIAEDVNAAVDFRGHLEDYAPGLHAVLVETLEKGTPE